MCLFFVSVCHFLPRLTPTLHPAPWLRIKPNKCYYYLAILHFLAKTLYSSQLLEYIIVLFKMGA